MEELDLIDEDNKVIGTGSREQCHKEGKLHRAVHIIVMNSKGEVFVQERSSKKDVFPGYWEVSLSGHVGTGESYEETALRELNEELGVPIEEVYDHPLENKGEMRIDAGSEQEIARLFFIRELDLQLTLDKEEVASGEFHSVEDVQKDIEKGEKNFTPGTLQAWKIFTST